MINKKLLILSALLISGCANTYKAIKPSALNFQNQFEVTEKIQVSYLYDVQSLTRNKRYSKKEKKAGLAAVALRIKNVTDHPITITKENFRILANGILKLPIASVDYVKSVRQTSGTYLLHALWGPWSYSYTEYGPVGVPKSQFRYYPVGAAIGIINLIVAETANKNHARTLTDQDIYGKSVGPGETLHGITIVPSLSYEPLTFEFVE